MIPDEQFKEYWLDTGWGCGYIKADSLQRVVETAPIFKKLIGTQIQTLKAFYKVKELRNDPR